MLDADGPMRAYLNSYAFNTQEAIRTGVLDSYLPHLGGAIRERLMLLDPTKPPRLPLPESHQVWAWMNHTDKSPCWEVRGTGVVLSPEHETEDERNARLNCGDWPAPCNCDDPETHGGH